MSIYNVTIAGAKLAQLGCRLGSHTCIGTGVMVLTSLLAKDFFRSYHHKPVKLSDPSEVLNHAVSNPLEFFLITSIVTTYKVGSSLPGLGAGIFGGTMLFGGVLLKGAECGLSYGLSYVDPKEKDESVVKPKIASQSQRYIDIASIVISVGITACIWKNL